jgi:hypothetical protein
MDGFGIYDFQGNFYPYSPIPIDPGLVGAYYDIYSPGIATAFSTAPTFYDGLANLGNVVEAATGYDPFAFF